MVLVTQNGQKVMVAEITHVCWAQHRSLKVQHLFEKPKLRYMTFETRLWGRNRNIALCIILQKIVNRIPTMVNPHLTVKTACEKLS